MYCLFFSPSLSVPFSFVYTHVSWSDVFFSFVFFFLKKFYFMLAFLSQWTDTDERNQIEGNASIGLLFSLDKKNRQLFLRNLHWKHKYSISVRLDCFLPIRQNAVITSTPSVSWIGFYAAHSAFQNLLALCFCVARYDRYRHFSVAFMNLLLRCDWKIIHLLGLFWTKLHENHK